MTVTMLNPALDKIMAQLFTARKQAAAHGHDVSRIAIGFNSFGDNLRMADDNGAYDYRIGLHGTYRACVGNPDRATESVANDPCVWCQ